MQQGKHGAMPWMHFCLGSNVGHPKWYAQEHTGMGGTPWMYRHAQINNRPWLQAASEAALHKGTCWAGAWLSKPCQSNQAGLLHTSSTEEDMGSMQDPETS